MNPTTRACWCEFQLQGGPGIQWPFLEKGKRNKNREFEEPCVFHPLKSAQMVEPKTWPIPVSKLTPNSTPSLYQWPKSWEQLQELGWVCCILPYIFSLTTRLNQMPHKKQNYKVKIHSKFQINQTFIPTSWQRTICVTKFILQHKN